MKKKSNRYAIALKLMRITLGHIVAVVLLAGTSYASDGNAQTVLERTVSVRLDDVTLSEALIRLEKAADVKFAYSKEFIDTDAQVSLNVRNRKIGEILAEIFPSRRISYEAAGELIVLTRSAPPVSRVRSAVKPVLIKKISRLQRQRTVSGKVTDAETGEPLPGVSITVKNTSVGTSTDLEGNYSLSVPDGNQVLVVSFLGYITEEVALRDQATVSIALQQDIAGLEEVIVVGYSQQKRREVTGAVSTVSPRGYENVPIQTFDRGLQGQASGVQVAAASGVPGAPVQINIRGMGSITAGNQPLFIVDGVQLNSETTTSTTASNPLAFLNPNDIESMTVLKDAAAASIYGAQAANGVVLITTKKGKAGKTQFNFNFYTGITEPIETVDMMNSQQFFQAREEALRNRYPARTDEEIRGNLISQHNLPGDLAEADAETFYNYIAGLPTYDWQDAAFRTGITNNYELSASGGNDKTTFFFSGAYSQQEGAVIGLDFIRGTAKLGATHQAADWLSLETNVNLATVTQDGTTGSGGSTGTFASPQYAGPMMLPFVPVYNPDGSFNAPVEGLPGDMRHNPVFTTNVNTIQSRTRSGVGNISATASITDELNFRSFFGIDYRTIRTENYRDPRTIDGFSRQGLLEHNFYESVNFITHQTLNYEHSFDGGHNLTALGGFEYRNDQRDYHFMSGEGFPTYQFRTMDAAATPVNASGNWTGFRRMGVFVQANYDFEKKYFFSGVLRYDGSSRFGTDNKFGWFPSVSAAWAMNQEDFLAGKAWIDELKLRVSYGETGNDDIGNFDSRGLYNGQGAYGGSAGIRPSAIANTELRWERNQTINLGLDYAFFDGRISGAVEVFQRTSKDLLLNRPLPYTSGFSSITSNVAEVVNKGLEISLLTDNIRSQGFNWSTNFNITFLDNEVTSLFDGLEVLPGNQRVRVGYPLLTNFRAQYAGVNSATGRAMWYDRAGNITYNPVDPEDFVPYGSELSDYYGGLTNTFGYKGVELSVFFQYDMGREFYNTQNAFWYRNGSTSRNTLAPIFEERWTGPGQVTNVPRPVDGGADGNTASYVRTSSRFLEDASYIRLKNVTLSYYLPATVVEKIRARSLRIYAQALNLYTWTKWTGYDPEFIIDGSNYTSNQGVIPQTRSVTFGVELGF